MTIGAAGAGCGAAGGAGATCEAETCRYQTSSPIGCPLPSASSYWMIYQEMMIMSACTLQHLLGTYRLWDVQCSSSGCWLRLHWDNSRRLLCSGLWYDWLY